MKENTIQAQEATSTTTQTATAVSEWDQKVDSVMGTLQVAFGFTLVLIMLGIIVYYFTNKRKDIVESPKYSMMDDDDENK